MDIIGKIYLLVVGLRFPYTGSKKIGNAIGLVLTTHEDPFFIIKFPEFVHVA